MSYQCSKCGALCEDDFAFCGNCGSPKAEANANIQPVAPVAQPVAPAALDQPDLPMKWYKFVIYFQLFANCVMNVISALSAITGTIYMGMAEEIFSYVPAQRAVDMGYGLILIGLAVLALVIRGRLKKFCADGPKKYLLFLGVNALVAVLYTVITNVVMSASVLGAYYEADYSSVFGSVAGNVVMILCCKKYFSKRGHMFVN